MSRPVVAVLGTASPSQAIIDDALGDWLNTFGNPAQMWFPASRTLTTQGVRNVAEWALSSLTAPEVEVRVVSAPMPGLRGKEIINDLQPDAVEYTDADVLDQLFEQITSMEGDHRYLLLLWEEGQDDAEMEDLAERALAAGLQVKALSSTGLDDIEAGDGDNENASADESEGAETPSEGDDTGEAVNAPQISGDNASEADSESKDPAPVPEASELGRLYADACEVLFRAIAATAREIVREELAAQRRRTTPDEGAPRAGEDTVTVVRLASGEIRPLSRGRLPAGAIKIQIPRSEAQELGVA